MIWALVVASNLFKEEGKPGVLVYPYGSWHYGMIFHDEVSSLPIGIELDIGRIWYNLDIMKDLYTL